MDNLFCIHLSSVALNMNDCSEVRLYYIVDYVIPAIDFFSQRGLESNLPIKFKDIQLMPYRYLDRP